MMDYPDPTRTQECPTCKRGNFVWRTRCRWCWHPFVPCPTDADILERFRGAAISTNPQSPLVRVVRGPYFDDEGYEQAVRLNGCVICTGCDMACPMFEEVDAWTEGEFGLWYGTEWGMGTAECPDCEKVFVDTFDGCYELIPTGASQ